VIKFIIKGIVRDKSRSLFPVIMVSIGAFLSVVLYCWLQGVMGDMVRSTAEFDTGHVKVVTRAYKELIDQIPNDLSLLEVDKLLQALKQKNKKIVWQARIRFGGMLDFPDKNGETKSQAPISGLAIDLLGSDSREGEILRLNKAVVRGRPPKAENEILVSDELAGKLGMQVGDTATLLGSTMNGSMAMYNFKIAGTIKFGITALDRSSVLADIQGIRKALDMDNAASEIVGFTKDHVYNDSAMKRLRNEFNQAYAGSQDRFSPVMLCLTDQRGMDQMVTMVNFIGSLLVAVFVSAMSIVLWNAGLMNSIRRYGEIGVRLAMGEPKGGIYRSMIIESLVIGLIGSVIGTFFGLAVSYYLQYIGFNMGDMMQRSSLLLTTEVRARVDAVGYFIGFIPGVGASIIGTCFAGIGVYRRQTSQLFKELES
jgi:putative ABC transport system permease protein